MCWRQTDVRSTQLVCKPMNSSAIGTIWAFLKLKIWEIFSGSWDVPFHFFKNIWHFLISNYRNQKFYPLFPFLFTIMLKVTQNVTNHNNKSIPCFYQMLGHWKVGILEIFKCTLAFLGDVDNCTCFCPYICREN